jgi:hypothetical protein
MDHYDLPRVSAVMYVGLCHKIGTPIEVTIRRDARDMKEKIYNSAGKHKGYLMKMLSGSYREGFRLKSSDRDYMYWHRHDKLISEISQARLYDIAKDDIILMEDNDSPPGFVKLQILTWPPRECLASSIVAVNDKVYISSFLYQKQTIENFDADKRHERVTSHGPCASTYIGTIEYDHASCIAGLHWPESTISWIERCFQYTWPLEPVLEEILENGYHCVPIGSKIASNENFLEWRLSFSQAEQKLVSSMNHMYSFWFTGF